MAEKLPQDLGNVARWEVSTAADTAGRKRETVEAVHECRCSSGEDDVFLQPQQQADLGQRNIREGGSRTALQPPEPDEKEKMGGTPEEKEAEGKTDSGTDKKAEAGQNAVEPAEKEQKPATEEREAGAEKEEDQDLQTDTGWAWVVMIANCVILFLMVGYSRALALFLFEFIDMFQVPTTTVTLSFGLMAAGNGGGNLMVAHALLPKMEERTVVMVGSFFFGLCVALTSLAPNMTFVIVIHFFLGVSQAMLYIPGLTLMGRYFRRRRSLAMAVANSGVSVSFLVFPALTQALIAAYGPRGALLLMSGIALQCLVAASLLRPFRHKAGKQENDDKSAIRKRKGGVHSVDGNQRNNVNATEDHSVRQRVKNSVQFIKDSKKRVSKSVLVQNGNAESHTTSQKTAAAEQGASDLDINLSTDDEDSEVLTPFLNAKPKTSVHNLDDIPNNKIKFVTDGVPTVPRQSSENCVPPSDGQGDAGSPLSGLRLSEENNKTRVSLALDKDCRVVKNHSLPKKPHCRCRAASLEYVYGSRTNDDSNPDLNLSTSATLSGSGNDDRIPKSGFVPDEQNQAARVAGIKQLMPKAHNTADTAIKRVMETRRIQRFYSCPEPNDADGRVEDSLTGQKCSKTSATRQMSKRAPDTFSGSVIDLCGASLASTVTLFTVDAVSVESLECSTDKLNGGRRGGCFWWCRSIVDLSLFSNWLFRLTLAYVPLGMTGGFVGFYFPSLGVSNGLSKEDAAFLLLIMGSLDLCSKLVIGYIADLQVVKTTHLVAGSMLVLGIATQFTRFYTGFGLLAAYAVLTGASGSVCPNLLAVVIIELLGLASLGKAMALVLLFNSTHAFLTHLVVGALADGTGSFSASYHYMGSCLLLSCCLLLLEPLAQGLERRRLERLASKGKQPVGEGTETV